LIIIDVIGEGRVLVEEEKVRKEDFASEMETEISDSLVGRGR